jgi:hypothetical protein
LFWESFIEGKSIQCIFDTISIDFNKNKEEYKTKYRTEINEQIPSADEFYGKYTTSEIVSEEEKKEE